MAVTSEALPSAQDVRAVYRLIHEVCEMGDDAHGWRARLFAQLLPMVDADMATAYVMKHPIDPSDIGPRVLLTLHYSLDESWAKYVERGDLTDNPITPGMMARMGTDFTCLREELIDDATWYASDFFNKVALPSNWDQNLNSQVAITPPGLVNGFGICRVPDKPAFTERDATLVRFVHDELARLWRRPDPLGIHTLPARQREVLDGIRRGESRKTIADKMSVSDHTVHTYEKALYERADVKSRGELLARLAKVLRPNLLP